MSKFENQAPLLDQSVVVVEPHQMSCALAGESIILNLQTGTYYGLNTTATRIWELIQQPIKIADLQSVIVREYEVKVSQGAADVVAMLTRLCEARLIRISNG